MSISTSSFLSAIANNIFLFIYIGSFLSTLISDVFLSINICNISLFISFLPLSLTGILFYTFYSDFVYLLILFPVANFLLFLSIILLRSKIKTKLIKWFQIAFFLHFATLSNCLITLLNNKKNWLIRLLL